MKKRILSFFLAVTFLFTVFFPVPALVSATVDDIFLPPEDFNLSLITVDSAVDSDYYNNISMQYKDIYKKVVAEIREHILTKDSFNYSGDHYQVYIPFIDIDDYECELLITDFELNWTMESGVLKLIPSTTSTKYSIYYISFDSDYNYMNHNGDYTNVKRYAGSTEITFLPSFYRTAFPDVVPTPSMGDTSCGIYFVDVDIDSFSEWIINNKRYEDITNCGLDVATDKIRYLVDWWSKYGSSPARIVLNLPKLIANINILSIDFDVISSVCKCIDSLYIEYKMYLNQKEQEKVRYAHGYWPGHLQEDDDGNKDYTYVTDTEEDDVYTSLLREILRAISSLPDLIATKFNYIQTYFDSFLIDLNRIINTLVSLPDYFSTSAYNVFIDPINQIIEALGNVGSNTNIEIEIPEEKQDEVDLFFDEWHTNFSEKLNSKIPVFTQLSELFNDNFFEKCGLDVNDDGEVYQYFTAGSVSSSGSTSDEVEAVESLLLQFDKADTNFANIEYSGDIPDGWTVTIAGNDIEIFDFKVFARYRSKIHIIIVFVAYTAYLLSLFKSLPTIIGNVSDVQNAFTSHFEQSRNKEE